MAKDSTAASLAADEKDEKDGNDAVPAKKHIAHPPADHLPEPGAAPGTAALLASQLQEGNKSLKLNDYTAARAHFKMAINVSPESVQAHAGLEKVTPPAPPQHAHAREQVIPAPLPTSARQHFRRCVVLTGCSPLSIPFLYITTC